MGCLTYVQTLLIYVKSLPAMKFHIYNGGSHFAQNNEYFNEKGNCLSLTQQY